MAHQLTRQQADYLVGLPKQIHEPIRWKAGMDSADRLYFVVVVDCTGVDAPMRLVGSVGKTNWSFALIAHETIPIRKLTIHGGTHKNPDGTTAGVHHKHIWDEVHEDQETYYPNDIDFSDVNSALVGFIGECNIVASQPPERLSLERRLR